MALKVNLALPLQSCFYILVSASSGRPIHITFCGLTVMLELLVNINSVVLFRELVTVP